MLVVLGIMLIVVGGIVTFGVDAAIDGLDLEAIGYIVMAGGVVALVAAAISAAGWMSVRTKDHHVSRERHVSADGKSVVDETHVS